jgi:CBS domain containing-hemolysin-like protein
MNIEVLWGLLAVFALVAANGFFVAGEFSLVKVRATRIDQLVAEGKGAARVVQSELTHLDNYIAATQLGITLASLALGWVGEPALAHLIDPLLEWVAGANAHLLADGVAVAISFGLITLFHIVLGELVPKSIALQRSESTVLLVARPLYLFARIFRPIILLMNGIGNWVVGLLGLHPAGEHVSVHSVEELEMLVTQSREAGVLDKTEEVLLRRVFDFGDKAASQVMTPRTEITGVPSDATLDQLTDTAMRERYTRFPVYQDTLDNIVGVVHVKDLFGFVRTHPGDAGFDVQKVMRPVLRVPETLHIEKLFPLMQGKKAHMVVVVDEYGGTAGIVTLEDIIEEIVGEVQDEFDTREKDRHPAIEVLPDGSSSVDGLLAVSDFAARFGVALDGTDYETIGGYVFGTLGRAPKLGDEVRIGPYQVVVEDLDNLRIARVRVLTKPLPPPPAGSDGADSLDSGSVPPGV